MLSLVGWTATGDLLFYATLPPEAHDAGTGLWRLRPGAWEPRLVLASPVYSYLGSWLSQWTADRRRLGVTLFASPGAWQPVLLSVGDKTSVQPLSNLSGYGPAVTRDASAVAYVSLPPAGSSSTGFAIEFRLLDQDSSQATGALSAADLGVDGVPPTSAGMLHWSPDGRTLVFVAWGTAYGTRLFAFDRETETLTHIAGSRSPYPIPLGFSADGQYLAYLENDGTEPYLWWVVRDLATGLETRHAFEFGHLRRIHTGSLQPGNAGVAAWAPTGHLLAVSSPSGVFVVDPATGDRRWLTLEACGRVVWWDSRNW